MLSLIRRAPATRAGRRFRVVLRLEGLDGRLTPSGELVPPVTPPPIGQDGQQTGNQAPQIVDLDAEPIGNGWYLITGRVIDERPGGLTVRFGGLSSMNGATATTDADGYFTYLVLLRTDDSDTGWLTAQTTDDLGLDSNEATIRVEPN